MYEDSLIAQCQAGDAIAFEHLLEQYYDTIYRFAYRWCGDQHNAQDITQLACIKLAKSISQFERQSSFTSWLYRLVINCAKDFYKSPTQHNQREESDENIYNSIGKSVADQNEQRFYAQQILEHINGLQDSLKDTLILIYGSGLSHSDAAKKLGIKESTVSWRVHEARKLLKETFASSRLNNNLLETVRGAL
jgi:RNA polymerase sigma-70 factor (ECF subfamily)